MLNIAINIVNIKIWIWIINIFAIHNNMIIVRILSLDSALSIWLMSFTDWYLQALAKRFQLWRLLHLWPIAEYLSGFPCRLQHLLRYWRWTCRRILWRIGVNCGRILVHLWLGSGSPCTPICMWLRMCFEYCLRMCWLVAHKLTTWAVLESIHRPGLFV